MDIGGSPNGQWNPKWTSAEPKMDDRGARNGRRWIPKLTAEPKMDGIILRISDYFRIPYCQEFRNGVVEIASHPQKPKRDKNTALWTGFGSDGRRLVVRWRKDREPHLWLVSLLEACGGVTRICVVFLCWLYNTIAENESRMLFVNRTISKKKNCQSTSRVENSHTQVRYDRYEATIKGTKCVPS